MLNCLYLLPIEKKKRSIFASARPNYAKLSARCQSNNKRGSFGIVGKNVRPDTKSLGVGYGADQNLLPSRQNHPRA
jgi:hypothetical protein